MAEALVLKLVLDFIFIIKMTYGMDVWGTTTGRIDSSPYPGNNKDEIKRLLKIGLEHLDEEYLNMGMRNEFKGYTYFKNSNWGKKWLLNKAIKNFHAAFPNTVDGLALLEVITELREGLI
jgi:hypothetical protein